MVPYQKGVTQLCLLHFTYSLFSPLTSMPLLCILGLAAGKPAVFTVDPSLPLSFITHSFLFCHNINMVTVPNGRQQQKISLSIPSLGGYYNSVLFSLWCSFTSDCDVVLGRDWLSVCRPIIRGNIFSLPGTDTVDGLPEHHSWTADGMLYGFYLTFTDTSKVHICHFHCCTRNQCSIDFQ